MYKHTHLYIPIICDFHICLSKDKDNQAEWIYQSTYSIKSERACQFIFLSFLTRLDSNFLYPIVPQVIIMVL